MANTVEISVRSKLMKIVEDLDAIAEQSKETSRELDSFGKDSAKNTETAVRRTETVLGRLRGMAASVAKNLRDDFKAMLSVAGLVEGMKLSNVFRNNISETVRLSDTIKKLASVFGIAEGRFADFQSKMTKGLGDIGLSSETATNALKGLSETQVRGEDTLLAYSKSAGQLAAATGERGKEGEIAKGMAGVLTARGLDPNDTKEMQNVADSLRRAFNAVGTAPSELLRATEEITRNMPRDMRKSISTRGLMNLAAVSATAGPSSTKFLEEYLSKSPVARMALEARGFKGVFSEKGLDVDKFRKASSGVMGSFKGDPRLMAQTLGLSEEAAEGFVRLNESLDRVDAAQKKMAGDNKTLEQQYYSAMTASEAFSASINKVKSMLAKPIGAAYEKMTSGLTEASKSTTGAAAVTVGGGLLATLLAGGGLRNLLQFGKSKATGLAERTAMESITGKSVQDVYVVNASEIGQASSGGLGGLGGPAGALGKAGMVGAAGVGGFMLGEQVMDPKSWLNQLTNQIPGVQAGNEAIESAVQKSISALANVWGGMTNAAPTVPQGPQPQMTTLPTSNEASPRYIGRPGVTTPTAPRQAPTTGRQKVDVNVQIDLKSKDIKATVQPLRGAAQ